jgi:PII-like signaling protein
MEVQTMKIRDHKKELKIYVKNEEKKDGVPVYKIIIDRLMELSITGCTILKSNSGYGIDMKVKYPDMFFNELWSRESTIIITIVESANKIEEIIKILDEHFTQGLVTVRDVEAIRYTKNTVTEEDIKLAENA